MFNKLLIILTLFLTLPTVANAWYVNAKASPATNKGTINPVGTQNYAAGINSGEYTVTPAAGCKVSRVTLDGVAISPNANGKYVAPYLASKSWRYIVAYFTENTVNITTSVTSGSGAIREDTFESLTNIVVGSNRQLLVIPNNGYSISSVTAPNASSIAGDAGGKTIMFNNLQANQTVSASFLLIPVVTVSAGNNVTANGASAEFAATLYGSATSNQGTITYAWTGTGLNFGSPNTAVTTVFADIPGAYTATLQVTSGGIVKQDSATVTIVDRTEYLETFCTGCHSLNTPLVVSAYDASGHKPGHISCLDCHTTAPHTDIQPACSSCHSLNNSRGLFWPPAGLSFHTDYSETNQCMSCHDVHNPGIIKGMAYPHFSNFTTAQYVTSNITCAKCHTANNVAGESSFNIYTANVEWAHSRKGDISAPAYVSYDFKTMGSPAPASPANSAADDCVRCHTTTGYINYVESDFQDIRAWGTSGMETGGDRAREMIACPVCHEPTPFNSFDGTETDEWGSPLQSAFTRRVVPQVTVYYNYSAQGSPRVLVKSLLPEQGASNNCIICHSGTRAGSTLKQIAAKVGAAGSFWNAAQFIAPHGMSGAGILYAKSGYTYPTTSNRNYAPSNGFAHPAIDDPYWGGQGACVGCHLYTDKPHLFSPVSKTNGIITRISAFDQVCYECHDGGNQPGDLSDPARMDAKQQGFISSLKALSAALAGKEIYYNSNLSPYFFNVSDPAQQGPVNSYYTNWNSFYNPVTKLFTGSDLMGAAFNLRLLWTDSGAYTHNSLYSKRLIYDSLDFLDDGAQNSSVYVAIQNLPLNDNFSGEDKARALDYIGVRP